MCITKITHQVCGHFYTSYVQNSTACAYETHEDRARKNVVHGWNAQICWDCGQRLFNVALVPEVTEWLENIKEGAPGGDGGAEKSAEGGKKGRKGIFVALPRLALLGRRNKAPDQEGGRSGGRGGGFFGRSSA